MMNKIVLFAAILMSTSLFAQENAMNKTVKVTARSEKEVSPDEVIYSITINQKRSSFEDAYRALDEEINNAIDILLKEKINKKSIKTTAYTVNKNFRWDKGQRYDDGFVATSRLEAKNELDTRRINKVLTRFGKESPDLNLNVSFSISDDLLEETKSELLTLAIKRAKNKALVICKALDKKLSDIQSVEYSEGGGIRPVFQKSMANSRAMSMADVSEHSSIENVKEIKLDLSVYTIWIIE